MSQSSTTPSLPAPLVRLAARQSGVLSVRQMAEAGVARPELRRRVRNGTWRPLRRGTYLVDAGRDPRELLVRANAVNLSVPRAVFACTTAAQVWGVRTAPTRPLEVIVPPGTGMRPDADLIAHEWPLARDEVTRWGNLPITSPARSVLDVCLTSDRLDAFAVLDEALRTGLVPQQVMDGLARTAARRQGLANVADLFGWADGRAESPLESRVRLRCLEAGLVPDFVQLEIRDGAFVARVDLAFRRHDGSLLLVEADGAAVHGTADAVHRDRVRSNHLVALGYVVIRFTWADTRDPRTVPAAIRAAL